MSNPNIVELQRVFTSRLAALEHVLDIGEKHFADADSLMGKRLADDMLPFSAQIAFACNSPRGFSQWCAGQPIDNLAPDGIQSMARSRSSSSSLSSRSCRLMTSRPAI